MVERPLRRTGTEESFPLFESAWALDEESVSYLTQGRGGGQTGDTLTARPTGTFVSL